MESESSSLTDLSEEEDYAPVKRGKKTTKNAGDWKLKRVLKPPRQTQYSAQTLYEEIMQGKVDLDPEYQRDVVWTDAKQTGLIDSLLRNYYIPPIILALSQSEDGEEKRTCIDGKQRLTSIQRFMDGMIPHKDQRSSQKFYYKLQPGIVGKLLPENYRRQFAKKQITCIEYQDISEDQERDIFQRVQLGVALTPAERMQAISGPYPRLIRDILALMANYKLEDFLEWSTQRGRDFQTIASATYLLDKPAASVPNSSMLDKWLARQTPPSKTFNNRIMDCFGVFCKLVTTPKFMEVFSKPARIAPVEFTWTIFLVNENMHEHTLSQLAAAIRRMRDDVRSKHSDIRSNAKVSKTLRAFVEDHFPKDLKKEPGEKKAVVELRESAPTTTTKSSAKRRREEVSEITEDEDEEDDRPLKSKVKKTKATGGKSGISKDSTTTKTKTGASTTGASSINTGSKPDRLANLRAAKEKAGIGKTTTKASTSSSVTQSPAIEQKPAPALQDVDMGVVESILKRSQTQVQQPIQKEHQHWPASPGAGGLAGPMQTMQLGSQQTQGTTGIQSRPSSAQANVPAPLQLTNGATGPHAVSTPYRTPTFPPTTAGSMSTAPTLSPTQAFANQQRPNMNGNGSRTEQGAGAGGRPRAGSGSATPDMPSRQPPPSSPRTFQSGAPSRRYSINQGDPRPSRFDPLPPPPRSPYNNRERDLRDRDPPPRDGGGYDSRYTNSRDRLPPTLESAQDHARRLSQTRSPPRGPRYGVDMGNGHGPNGRDRSRDGRDSDGGYRDGPPRGRYNNEKQWDVSGTYSRR